MNVCRVCEVKLVKDENWIIYKPKYNQNKYICRDCEKERQKEYMKEYRSCPDVKQREKEYKKEYMKEYRSCPDIKQREKEYWKEYLSRPDIKQRRKEYWKEYQKEYMKEYLSRPDIKLICNIRTLIGLSFRNGGFSKKSKTYEILGCSFKEFKTYLENQYLTQTGKKFDWDKKHLFELDHKIPISTAQTEEEIIKLNHYSNFQLMKGIKNREKYNSRKDIDLGNLHLL